jgi:DNA-binding transcriptional MerR regulator
MPGSPEATRDTYRTVDLAKAAGAHPNTVHLYEEWGFLPPVPRDRNGWRCYSGAHLDQMVLARMALHGMWPGPRIRESAIALVRVAAAGDLADARRKARAHLDLVRHERRRADEAAAYLERWAQGKPSLRREKPLTRREAAATIDATAEQVRNWERNGLVRSVLDPCTRCRTFGASEVGRLHVIRALLRAGYSIMAVRRMTRALDRGTTKDLSKVLDTPHAGEDVLTAFDRWLSTLAMQEERARRMMGLIKARRPTRPR